MGISDTNLQRNKKGALESRWYCFDFSQYPEIRDYGQSIVTVNMVSIVVAGSDGTADLQCTNTAPQDKDGNGKNERAAFKLTNGTAGVSYIMTVTAVTDQGNTLEGRGMIDVIA